MQPGAAADAVRRSAVLAIIATASAIAVRKAQTPAPVRRRSGALSAATSTSAPTQPNRCTSRSSGCDAPAVPGVRVDPERDAGHHHQRPGRPQHVAARGDAERQRQHRPDGEQLPRVGAGLVGLAEVGEERADREQGEQRRAAPARPAATARPRTSRRRSPRAARSGRSGRASASWRRSRRRCRARRAPPPAPRRRAAATRRARRARCAGRRAPRGGARRLRRDGARRRARTRPREGPWLPRSRLWFDAAAFSGLRPPPTCSSPPLSRASSLLLPGAP